MNVFFPKLFIYSGCTAVSIYHTDNRIYKIFDSHARDKYDRSHSIDTCVPEKLSIQRVTGQLAPKTICPQCLDIT